MAGDRPGPKKGDPRCVEAGKKAGRTLATERGPEYFRNIGKKGGKMPKRRRGEA